MSSKTIVNDAVFLAKGFVVDTNKNRLDLAYVYRFLTEQSYWAKNLSYEKFTVSVANSTCFGLYQNGKQVGFARVISDFSTFAYLADVFIDETCRKQSLGKWLLQCVLAHPDFKDLRRWLLATADAHNFYRQFGFNNLNQPERFMQIFKPYIAKG